MKNKYATIGIILTTIILAGVAIFTALRLYQTRSQSVAPNVPSSKPKAADVATATPIACRLSFVMITPSPTPTTSPSPTPSHSPNPTPTPTRSPSLSPTASPVPQCNTQCTTSSQCPSGLTCYIANGQTSGNCRKTSCLTEADCVCATATPSPTPTTTPTSAPTKSPTASPVAQCNSSCTQNSNCPSSMVCNIPSGSTSGNCRNAQCLSETDCVCNVVITAAPTETPSLPNAGTTWPTIIGTGFGILVIIGSLLLAL